jgi:hypothetical protein
MKKLFSTILSVILVFALFTSSFADELIILPAIEGNIDWTKPFTLKSQSGKKYVYILDEISKEIANDRILESYEIDINGTATVFLISKTDGSKQKWFFSAVTPSPSPTQTPTPTPTPTPKPIDFKDTKNHWAKVKIEQLVGIGAVSGYSDRTFKPEKNITWGEYITILIKALRYEPELEGDTYKVGDHFARPFIQAAVENKIVDVNKIKKINPNEDISKIDSAYLMFNASKKIYSTWVPNVFKDLQNPQPKLNSDPFKDGTHEAILELNKINTLYAKYLIEGTVVKGERFFYPLKKITRAEAVSMITNVRAYNVDPALYTKTQQLRLTESKNFVKAIKDEAFEKFINSDAAKPYASTEYFRAENGVIIFKQYAPWNYVEAIADNKKYKDLNKVLYNVVKDMVVFARRDKKFVNVKFNRDTNNIFVQYYDDRNFGMAEKQEGNIRIVISLDGYRYNENQKKDSIIGWHINRITESSEVDINGYPPLVNGIYATQAYQDILKEIFVEIYGKSGGLWMYKHAIDLYMNQVGDAYKNTSIEYFSGYEVINEDYSLKGFTPYFSTCIK